MPSYLRPGVYLEEDASTAGPAPAVRQRAPSLEDDEGLAPRWVPEHTHTAFVGFTPDGPFDTPTWIHSWSQFRAVFDPLAEGTLALSVYGFFSNGGQSCVVVRVPSDAERLVEAFVGDYASRTGIAGLDTLDDVSIVCAPDVMLACEQGLLDPDQARTIQLALIAHCEMHGDRIAIVDCPPGLDVQGVRTWRMEEAGYDSSYAVLYYPWIRVYEPSTGRFRHLPPSGHIAGVYAQVDLMRGFHHTPANQTVAGAVDVETAVTSGEQDILNPIGINSIVPSVGRGAVLWGSRTLSSDPAWRYIHRRRLVTFVLRNIRVGTQWAIFERKDDPALPRRVANHIRNFLYVLWRAGALRGETPEDAFWVAFDDNPEYTDAGLLYFNCNVTVERDLPLDFRLAYFCDT